MYQPKMKLTPEQQGILEGKEGEAKAKMMESIVRLGDMFEAPRLAKVTHEEGHLVSSFGIGLLVALYPLMDQLIAAGVKAPEGFTVDPRPYDFQNVKCSPLEKLVFTKIIYSQQEHYEEQLTKLGLKSKDSFTCACYFPEVGNTPKKGDVLSWAESSAVVYANSVLGAQCNRNSGVMDLFGSIIGYVPEFGFLTEEGRKASFKVIVKTSKLPEAQILGSAIGIKVQEQVPYVEGLDQWLKPLPDQDTIAYLKDFGAATASNGAVGLYHIDKITPDAVEKGESLIKPDAQTYVIDDAEIERVYKNYPVLWKNKDKQGNRCFIGCPHLTLRQLNNWTDKISSELKRKGHKKVVVRTVLTTAPGVAEEFKKTPKYQELLATGCTLSSICPLMYADSPLSNMHRLMTNSNKLRTYSSARYYKDAEVLDIITGKESK
jgi:predicted aconitase